ncbi:MAG: type I DNA topoisomerase [bacterium]
MIIVESKAKTQSIGKIVGDDYLVLSSLGHIYDLPENNLGVDIKNGFRPRYLPLKEKKKLIQELQAEGKKFKTIILATDPDREGESIAWHLKNLFPEKRIYRMRFNEITKKAVLEALKNLTDIDQQLVDAQQARRILDRLVGYKISPLLRRGFSAGRVQSVALRLICEREKEVMEFMPKEYWKITALFGRLKTDETFKANFIGIDEKEIELINESDAEHYRQKLEKHEYHVEKITRREETRRPYPPYTTSTLQQDASRRLGFSPARTMTVAQQLYEGINIGAEGIVGLITYMRTDSVRVSEEAQQQARSLIEMKFGAEYLPSSPPKYMKKGTATQDAHEAVRPTDANREPSLVEKFLSPEQQKLYTLIWNRFIASQMKPAVVEAIRVDIINGSALFRATDTKTLFDGFTRVYTITSEAEEEEKSETLPDLIEGEPLRLCSLDPSQHFTKPPPRYNEGSLIRALEEKGIGRPSTYVPTIETLKKRQYVKLNKRTLFPTEWGINVTKLLIENFEDIMDYDFTARMESTLDEVEEGKTTWEKVVENFYETFSQELDHVIRKLDAKCEKCGSQMTLKEGRYGIFYACANYPHCKNTKAFKGIGAAEDLDENGNRLAPKPTDEKCEKCGAPMLLREGRYGAFLACSAYPKCKNTKPHPEAAADNNLNNKVKRPAPKPTDKKCKKCGAPMLLREGRYGTFLACSAYPKCRNAFPYIGEFACPRKGCDGRIVKKIAKNRRSVYGCTRYPDCNFATWFAPLEDKCPHCGTFLIRKKVKGKYVLLCASDECGREVDKKSAVRAAAKN